MSEPPSFSRTHASSGHGRVSSRPRTRAVVIAIARVALLATLPAAIFYAYLHYSEAGYFPTLRKNLPGYTAAILIGIIVAFALQLFNKTLNRWIKWSVHFSTRFLVGFICNSMIAFILVTLLSEVIIKTSGQNTFWVLQTTDDPDVVWKISILLAVFVFIYNVTYALLYAYQHYAVAKIDQLQHERKQLELQFEALKSQISPHYLFNSLNTISSLMLKDVQSAEQFIRRLAQTYQYVLATQHKKYVTLREELDFVQSYYYLLRIRFQQQLDVDINIPPGIMDSSIPPLTLQMLLENAVKHNSFSGETKLFIYIVAQDNTYLKVINTKTGMLANVPSFQIGLENIRQRYNYLTEKQIIVQNDEQFVVSLPVILQREENEERKNSA